MSNNSKWFPIGISFLITSIFSGLLINVIQASLYYTLRYVNKPLYRKINYYLMYSIYSLVVVMFRWFSKANISYHIKDENFRKNLLGKEHALCITNHRYNLDWVLAILSGENFGLLGSYVSIIKSSIQYIPCWGWLLKFSEFIFLHRSMEKDKGVIVEQMNDLGDYPYPIWIQLCPEGTRVTPEKLKVSQEFSKQRGLPILKHHLTPRTKGFDSCLQGMNGKIKAIYNIQFAFADETQVTFKNILTGNCPSPHAFIERIPVEDIPKTEEERSKWLHKLFEKKDQLQELFYKTGSFSEKPYVKPIRYPRTIYTLIITILWKILVWVPIVYYSAAFIMLGEPVYILSVFGTFVLVGLIIRKLLEAGEGTKNSTYGITSAK